MTTACAGDGRVEPENLELRDLLGIAPDTSLAWDAHQRAAARRVLDDGLHARQPVELALAPSGNVAKSLASADRERDQHALGALGLVDLAPLHASARTTTLAPRARPAVAAQLQLAGWAEHPRWKDLPARGLDVLATIAWDAGHRSGPLVVSPAPQLAVIAAYAPGVAGAPATLVVNPVLLAALEPVAATTAPTTVTAVTTTTTTVTPVAAPVVALDPIGNPYTFYASIAECSDAQQQRCTTCIAGGSCDPLVDGDDGVAECTKLAADTDRGYALACINFALAIDPIASCTAAAAGGCPFERDARLDLDQNADFLDRPECASALDVCLDERYGSVADSSTAPAPDSSPSCGDAASSGCGAACADDSGDDSCDSSDDSGSSCSDSGGGGDSCSSSDGGGDDCSSGDSSGCSDAGDSGGDCSGGGGDDCNVAAVPDKHDRDHRFLWALLPLPFAVIARRRADRRRAAKEVAP